MSHQVNQSHTPIETDATSSLESVPSSWRYEDTVAEIETIIAQIELGELDLAEVFEQFTTAVEYLRQCEAFLNHHHQQMNLLIETLVDQTE